MIKDDLWAARKDFDEHGDICTDTNVIFVVLIPIRSRSINGLQGIFQDFHSFESLVFHSSLFHEI